MSEETAREQAEREIGRMDDKRKTPERRAYRSGDGRRRNDSWKPRRKAADAAPNPSPQRSPESPSVDQRRFNRV